MIKVTRIYSKWDAGKAIAGFVVRKPGEKDVMARHEQAAAFLIGDNTLTPLRRKYLIGCELDRLARAWQLYWVGING